MKEIFLSGIEFFFSPKVPRGGGNLNLLVRASLHSKPILVHVDRVRRALSSADKLVRLDGKEESFPPLPAQAASSGEK